MTTRFYIVRHGQTDWNVDRKIQGHTDIPLNDTGREQARQLRDRLRNISFSACFASDLSRAYETASILAEMPVTQDKRLRERYCGSWEGSYWPDLHTAPSEQKRDLEDLSSMSSRALECLEEITRSHKANVLVVTHGALMRSLILHMMKLEHDLEELSTLNTAMIQVHFKNGVWSIIDLEGITIPQR